jgi:hypothetical protein
MTANKSGNVNIVVYVRDKLNESDISQIRNIKLIDVIRQLGSIKGDVKIISDHVVAVYNTDNFYAATLKLSMGRWCSVETFAENHVKLTPNLGTLARGSK